MALAAYGEDTYVAAFRDLVRPTPEGRYQVNFDYFSFDAFGELRPFTRRFLEVFGPSRQPGEELRDRHRDIARALQTVTEEIVLHMARGLRRTSGARQLCISGGVGLNCVANARVLARPASTGCGCRPAPPIPARRSAARCGITTRASASPGGSS